MKTKRCARVLLTLFVLCAGMFVSSGRATVWAAANADGSVLINEANFPDQNFRNYLMNELIDDVLEGPVYSDDISRTKPKTIWGKNELDAVRKIKVGYLSGLNWKQGAYDLRGIENFYNLETIVIRDVSNLTGSVPALPKLNTIVIEEGDLSDLSFYKLDFSVLKQKLPLARIRNFSIVHPTLGTVDLSALEKMEHFSLGSSYVERCIYEGALDFKKNKRIKEIHIENSNLTKLNVSANTELNRLELVRTNVKNLDLSKNKKLKELYIGKGSGVTFRLPAKNCLEKLEVNMASGSLDLTSCTVSLKEISRAQFKEKGAIKVWMKRSVLKELLEKKGLRVEGKKLKRSQVKFPKKGKYAYFKM